MEIRGERNLEVNWREKQEELKKCLKEGKEEGVKKLFREAVSSNKLDKLFGSKLNNQQKARVLIISCNNQEELIEKVKFVNKKSVHNVNEFSIDFVREFHQNPAKYPVDSIVLNKEIFEGKKSETKEHVKPKKTVNAELRDERLSSKKIKFPKKVDIILTEYDSFKERKEALGELLKFYPEKVVESFHVMKEKIEQTGNISQKERDDLLEFIFTIYNQIK